MLSVQTDRPFTTDTCCIRSRKGLGSGKRAGLGMSRLQKMIQFNYFLQAKTTDGEKFTVGLLFSLENKNQNNSGPSGPV